MAKLISNKDGACGSRASGYSAWEPNTYDIVKEGVVVGVANFLHDGQGGAWLASSPILELSVARTYFADLRKVVSSW